MKLSHKACVESELGKTDIYIYIYITSYLGKMFSYFSSTILHTTILHNIHNYYGDAVNIFRRWK